MFGILELLFNKKSVDANPFYQKAAGSRDIVSLAIERSGFFHKGSMNISLPSNHSKQTTALSICQPIFQHPTKEKILNLWKLTTQQPLKLSFESSKQSNAVGFCTSLGAALPQYTPSLGNPPLTSEASITSTSLPSLDHPISQHSPFSFFSWFNNKAPEPTKLLADEFSRHCPANEEVVKMWNATQAATPGPTKFLADEFSRHCPANEEVVKMWNATQAATPGPTKLLADEFSRHCPANEEIVKMWNATQAATPGPTKFLADEFSRHCPANEEVVKMWNATQAATPGPTKLLADEFSRHCPANEEIVKMWNATQAATPGPTKLLADEFSRHRSANEEVVKMFNGVVHNSTKDPQSAITHSYTPWIIGGLATLAAGCWLYKKYFPEKLQEKQDLTANVAEFEEGLRGDIATIEAEASSQASERTLEIVNSTEKETSIQESSVTCITCFENEPINQNNTSNAEEKQQPLTPVSIPKIKAPLPEKSGTLKKLLNFISVLINTLRSIFDIEFLDTKRKHKFPFDSV